MARIDFKQVAAPIFNDSNNLIELAMKQGTAATEGLQKTWEAAMGAVKNKNHAEMIGVLNQQSAADLDNPQTVQALMEQFRTMAAPTGGNFDPMVIQAAIDGRGDTLRAREGVKLDNAMGNVNLQQGVENYSNSVVTNKNTLDAYERDVKAKQYQNNIQKSADISAGYQAYIGSLDPNTDADAIAQLTAKRDEALQGIWGGEIPLDAFGGISAINEKNALDKRTKLANIEGKEVSTDLAINADARNTAEFGFRVEQAALNRADKQASTISDKATLNGLNPDVITPEGRINGPAANQQLMTNINEAQRIANAPPNSVPFSERVNEYIGKGENKAISPDKLRQMQIALNTYASQSKDGKSLQLTEDDRWAVFQGVLSGEIQSDKWSVGELAGMSNYQGLFEEVIPKYMKTRKQQTQPANNNLIAADEMGKYFKSLGAVTDQVTAAQDMGILPGTPMFMYLPEHIRKKLDPKGSDKRRYTDVPTANEKPADVARKMEQKVRSKTKPASERMYMLGR